MVWVYSYHTSHEDGMMAARCTDRFQAAYPSPQVAKVSKEKVAPNVMPMLLISGLLIQRDRVLMIRRITIQSLTFEKEE